MVDDKLVPLVGVSAASVAVALVAIRVFVNPDVGVGSGVAVGVTRVSSTSGGSSLSQLRRSLLQTNAPL